MQEELARLPHADTPEGREQQRQVWEGFLPVHTCVSKAGMAVIIKGISCLLEPEKTLLRLDEPEVYW